MLHLASRYTLLHGCCIVTAKIKSTDKSARFYRDLFIPFSFVMFNLWDTVGRVGAGWIRLIPNTRGSLVSPTLSMSDNACICCRWPCCSGGPRYLETCVYSAVPTV